MKNYDYAIVGAGAAGMQLAYFMSLDNYFSNKQILILDKPKKIVLDKTWCFWERQKGPYDSIITQSWKQAKFFSEQLHKTFDLDPYLYKMLRSEDFNTFMFDHFRSFNNLTFLEEEVYDIETTDEGAVIRSDSNTYKANHVFDSRISKKFTSDDNKILILQHFKGYYIKTKSETFDTSVFTMMDYRLKFEDHTSFTYVLPISKFEALVEFTLFDSELLKEEAYDPYLRQYIDQYLEINQYEITKTEYGVIPMSTYAFRDDHSRHITKIGTAGGWVRASSGYSFNNAQVNARKIVENIKANHPMTKGLYIRRHEFFDHLLLDILKRENHLGDELFSSLYGNTKIQNVFKFLDSDSSLIGELKVIMAMPKKPFLKALIRFIFSL